MNATETLGMLMYEPTEVSILLKANHGVGKSQVVKQAAKALGVPLIDIRLSQCDVGDLKGMPFHVKGRTFFAPPDFMPINEKDAKEIETLINEPVSLGIYGDNGILFLDEINRASREVQQAAFELVLDRRLNMRAIPDGWRVVAAINDDADLYNVVDMDPAFIDRFVVVPFVPTIEEWFSWAKENKIHPAIVEFIRRNPSFYKPKKEAIEAAATEASTGGSSVNKLFSPRSWEKFSLGLTKKEEAYNKKAPYQPYDPLEKTDKSLEFLYKYAQCYVGTMAAREFQNFIRTDYQSLDANIILNKWSADIESQLKAIVDRKGIPELGHYNELLIEYIKDNVSRALNKVQSENLFNYIKIIPNEVCTDFWKKFNADCRDISTEWYKNSHINKDVKTRIMGALANPEALKKRNAEENK